MVGVQQIDRVVEVVEETLKGKPSTIQGNKIIKSTGLFTGRTVLCPCVMLNDCLLKV